MYIRRHIHAYDLPRTVNENRFPYTIFVTDLLLFDASRVRSKRRVPLEGRRRLVTRLVCLECRVFLLARLGHVVYGPPFHYELQGEVKSRRSSARIPAYLPALFLTPRQRYPCALATNLLKMRPPLNCKRSAWFELPPLLILGSLDRTERVRGRR